MNGEWTNKLSALVKSVGNFAKQINLSLMRFTT